MKNLTEPNKCFILNKNTCSEMRRRRRMEIKMEREDKLKALDAALSQNKRISTR